jgi:hypothetical protein
MPIVWASVQTRCETTVIKLSVSLAPAPPRVTEPKSPFAAASKAIAAAGDSGVSLQKGADAAVLPSQRLHEAAYDTIATRSLNQLMHKAKPATTVSRGPRSPALKRPRPSASMVCKMVESSLSSPPRTLQAEYFKQVIESPLGTDI